MECVLVIGATGRVGAVVAADLLRRGIAIRMAVRQPGRSRSDVRPGTPEVLFDFERPETFEPALVGVDRVFLIARPGDDEADRVSVPLVKAMQRRGIRHVVNLTAMGVEALPDTALRKIECAIEESGIGFTHLRPNFFMQIFAADPLLSALRHRNILAVPAAEATLSFVDARDVGAVAAAALAEPGHDGRAYTLTGGHAITHREVADVVASVSGCPVRYVPLDDETARRLMVESGLAAPRADRLIGFYRQVRAGFCSAVSTDVESVLGRPATSFEQFARDHKSVWSPGVADSPRDAARRAGSSN